VEASAGSVLPDLGPAPELRGIAPWLNTPGGEPLTIAGLAGQVVLIEFWTFACTNCVRTIPFLRQMHSRHEGRLTVVGIHTPESPFERRPFNVARAVRDRSVSFPVGLDNDLATWEAYANRYWPTIYLVDAGGRIRYSQVGEGHYRRSDAAIRALLAERAVTPKSISFERSDRGLGPK
jgi:thiol-disulfide isomerase/thioredoxin